MADLGDKAAKSAEEAYAAAAAAPAQSESAKAEAAPLIIDQPVTDEASVGAPAKGAAPRNAKPAKKKPAMTNRRTISKPRRVPAPKAAAARAKATTPTIAELKDNIMATAKTTDFTKPFTDAIGDVQSKTKAAYDKGAELAAEATEFAKGNVEALVESGKIYAAGVQNLGKAYADEAKTAYETLTADLKELAAVKSPTELFQLQARLARRNFDAMVAYGAKDVHVFSAAPDGGFAARVGDRLQRRWPDDADFQKVRPRLIFVADVDDGLASSWRDMSHKVGGLVHVQDRIPLCDFHMPAILRRGRLQVTVSTDGTAPGLARILRDYLATRVFGAEWSARVEEMSKMRQRWKQDGLPLPKLSNAIHDFLRTRGWLDT